MTPRLYAKIRRLAEDPACDPMTRKIAQAQLDAHNGMAETPRVVPGMRQTPEYQAYAKALREANRGRKN
jgi:hypothetical protein